MAKIRFDRSGDEGRHVFCAVIRIKLSDDDMEKIMGGGIVMENLEEDDIDFKFIIKKRREGEERE